MTRAVPHFTVLPHCTTTTASITATTLKDVEMREETETIKISSLYYW